MSVRASVGADRSQPDEETQDDGCAGAVGNQKQDDRPVRDTWELARRPEWWPRNDRRTGGVANRRETSGCQWKREKTSVHIKAPRTVIMEKTDPSLVIQGWVGDKPWLVTFDTRMFVTVARPDVTARWPERQLNHRFTLQMVSGETLPILKDVFLTKGSPWHTEPAHWWLHLMWNNHRTNILPQSYRTWFQWPGQA
jgi:hypothetical protein